jgi:hypothetical protein
MWKKEVCKSDLIMKTKQWTEKTKIVSNGDWLLRRPRLNLGCSAERMDEWTCFNNHDRFQR